jgi:hypothetical protein
MSKKTKKTKKTKKMKKMKKMRKMTNKYLLSRDEIKKNIRRSYVIVIHRDRRSFSSISILMNKCDDNFNNDVKKRNTTLRLKE